MHMKALGDEKSMHRHANVFPSITCLSRITFGCQKYVNEYV